MTGSAAEAPVLVGLDWGSSALRAYLIDRGGTVLWARRSDGGASPARQAATNAAAFRPVASAGCPGR